MGAKGKSEALRMKKKLEGDVLDLECNLEHANAANAETQRNIKTYQLGLREAQSKLEGEQLSKEKAHDALIVADRKCNSNQNALEEARTLLEQGKIKSYKKQIEEAEEIAALNLAKYRQAQNSVADATERADTNEQTLAKNRARARSASIGPM